MPPKQPRYYIRLPANPNLGIKGGYYQVDPDALSISILTELYRRDDRSGNLIRAYSVGSEIELNDPAELLSHWRELREQIRQLLPNSGLAGEFAAELLNSLNGLPRLIEALARGRLNDATGAIDTLGDDLLTLAANVTDNLATLEARMVELGQPASEVTESDQERLYAAIVESLADNINEGIRAFRKLAAFEAELDQLIQSLEPLSLTWSQSGQAGDTWLEEQLAYLDDRSGFSRQASRFLGARRTGVQYDPDLIDLMRTVIGGARERMQAIATRLAEAQAEHARASAQAEAVLEGAAQMEALIRTMSEARDEMDKLSQTGADPQALVSGLITNEEFATWQGLRAHPDWQSLHEARARLRDKAELVRRLLGRIPALSPAETEVLEDAQGYIAQVEAALAEPGQPAPEPVAVPAPTVVATAQPARVTKAAQAPKPAGYDPQRLDALYEVMLFIGAVKYCGPQHLVGGTPNAMMDLMEMLGQLTPDERDTYNDALREQLSANSLTVETNRLKAWTETDPSKYHWIQFKQGRGGTPVKPRSWRLVKKGKNAALALGVKYGITEERVKEAYKIRLARYKSD